MLKYLVFLLSLLSLQAQAIQSESYIVKNLTDNVVISERNTTEILTPASITKMMTVLVVLESGKSLDERLVIPKTTDTSNRIRPGMSFTRGELIQLALVASDNKAARALGYYEPDFVQRMNDRAKTLGMLNTNFVEPTGRNYSNVTTVDDLVLLLGAARAHGIYKNSASTVQLSLVQKVKNKIRKIVGNNTNPMAGNEHIVIAKTGFTNAARFCIASIVHDGGKEFAIVLLGAPNKKQRLSDFREAMTLIGV